MSYQVDTLCFATLGDSAAASCANFVPFTGRVETGTHGVETSETSCIGSDSAGRILIQNHVFNKTYNNTYSNWITPVFQPCLDDLVLDSFVPIFVAILAGFFSFYGVYKIYAYHHWSEREKGIS